MDEIQDDNQQIQRKSFKCKCRLEYSNNFYSISFTKIWFDYSHKRMGKHKNEAKRKKHSDNILTRFVDLKENVKK